MIVISLGFHCYVKWLIEKIPKYNKETDIFDWLNSFDMVKLVESLENNFNIFDDITRHHQNRIHLYNKKYDFRLPHEKNYWIDKKPIIEKYKRRHMRFLNYKNNTHDNFLFIRLINDEGPYGSNMESSSNYTNEVYDRLIKFLPKNSKIILLCEHHMENKNKISDNFILIENAINPLKGMVVQGLRNKYKNIYGTFLNYCDKNYDALDYKILERLISNDLL